MRRDTIDRTLDRLDRNREALSEDIYHTHMRNRRARWLRWAARVADSGDDARALADNSDAN